MITNVAYKPTWTGPAYNPIIWSVLSSKVNSTDFKYVFEVYVDDVKINTVKQRANISGYGMIDVATLVQGYLSSASPSAKITQGETSIDYNNGDTFSDNYLMSRKVYLKVGEEYTVNNITQTYIGTADTPGAPAYVLTSGNTTTADTPVHIWNASLTDHEQQWNMQKTTVSGIWGDNPFDGNKNYDHGLGLARPLMKGSLVQDLYEFDKMVLSYLNWTPNIVDANDRAIFGFRYKIYDSNGGTQTFDKPMTASNGFGQRAACENTIDVLDPRYSIVNVLAGPSNIYEAVGYVVNYPVTKIEITGYTQATDNCTFGVPVTETVTINVLESCPNPLYRRVRLSWFNELGGRNYMNFNMFVEKSITTSQQMYAQEQMNWSNSTPVPMLNDSLPIGNLGIKGGSKIFNKEAQVSYKLQSDWLDQEQVDLVEGLIKSPQVMAYIDNGNTISHEFPYTCSVINNSYSVKNIRQVKLTQAEIEIKLFTTQKLQNL